MLPDPSIPLSPGQRARSLALIPAQGTNRSKPRQTAPHKRQVHSHRTASNQIYRPYCPSRLPRRQSPLALVARGDCLLDPSPNRTNDDHPTRSRQVGGGGELTRAAAPSGAISSPIISPCLCEFARGGRTIVDCATPLRLRRNQLDSTARLGRITLMRRYRHSTEVSAVEGNSNPVQQLLTDLRGAHEPRGRVNRVPYQSTRRT